MARLDPAAQCRRTGSATAREGPASPRRRGRTRGDASVAADAPLASTKTGDTGFGVDLHHFGEGPLRGRRLADRTTHSGSADGARDRRSADVTSLAHLLDPKRPKRYSQIQAHRRPAAKRLRRNEQVTPRGHNCRIPRGFEVGAGGLCVCPHPARGIQHPADRVRIHGARGGQTGRGPLIPLDGWPTGRCRYRNVPGSRIRLMSCGIGTCAKPIAWSLRP